MYSKDKIKNLVNQPFLTDIHKYEFLNKMTEEEILLLEIQIKDTMVEDGFIEDDIYWDKEYEFRLADVNLWYCYYQVNFL